MLVNQIASRDALRIFLHSVPYRQNLLNDYDIMSGGHEKLRLDTEPVCLLQAYSKSTASAENELITETHPCKEGNGAISLTLPPINR